MRTQKLRRMLETLLVQRPFWIKESTEKKELTTDITEQVPQLEANTSNPESSILISKVIAKSTGHRKRTAHDKQAVHARNSDGCFFYEVLICYHFIRYDEQRLR